MQRPQRLANKVVEQWEQNLLLKVMQRKIKCAKSTINGTKKSQSQAPLVQKTRECLEMCKEEWNMLDAEQKHYFNKTLKSQLDESAEQEVDGVPKDRDKENSFNTPGRHGDATPKVHPDEENISPRLGASYELGFPLNLENFVSLTERFHENSKDSDDYLLNQIWSSCKGDNLLFDVGTGLNQTRRAGALHAADFDSSPIPMSKMALLKGKRIPKTHHRRSKKNVPNEPATVSKFMKKRETGWRE